ncbi:MAG: electron transfer flavoprotein subunit alpha/FixB family protein, partial [Bacteroidales bacterium]|nr:electron transfer flavoprotein subunit alpha/FixB family protein [Bacteroidales bacterium]
MDKSEYKNVYVFIEQRDNVIQKVALELLGKAHDLAGALNEKVYAVLLGHNIADKAQELIAYGADHVLLAEDECLK